tara:strand:- start:691 stop:2262 length:1572 start_codon:yes stop_codon:yes gene_type:complete
MAQESIQTTSSGYGPTEQEAINIALINALQETLGGYLSSNTKILNDKLVKDEISAITDGEVFKYKKLETKKISEQEYFVILDVTITKSKLAKYFSRNDENSVIFEGDKLQQNLKIIAINKTSEVNSIKNLVEVADGFLNKITNYKVYKKEEIPEEVGTKFELEYLVEGKTNINIDELSSLIISSLYKITLDKSEIKKLKKYKQSIYDYKIYSGNTGAHKFYFRNPASIEILKGFSNKIENSYSDFNLLINNSSNHKFKKTLKKPTKYIFFNKDDDQIGIWSFKALLSLEELSKDSVSIDRKNVLPKGVDGKDSARETKIKLNKLIRKGNRTKAISIHIGAGMNYFGVSDLNYFVENYTFYSPGDGGVIEYFDIDPNFISFESATFMLSTGVRFYDFVDLKLSYSFGKSDIGSPSPYSGIESNFRFNNLDLSASLILFDSSKSLRPFGGLSYGIMTALELNQYYNGGLINLREKQSFNYYGINAGFIYSNNRLGGFELRPHMVYSLGGDMNVNSSIRLEVSYNF